MHKLWNFVSSNVWTNKHFPTKLGKWTFISSKIKLPFQNSLDYMREPASSTLSIRIKGVSPLMTGSTWVYSKPVLNSNRAQHYVQRCVLLVVRVSVYHLRVKVAWTLSALDATMEIMLQCFTMYFALPKKIMCLLGSPVCPWGERCV